MKAYNNWKESETMMELEAIRNNQEAIHMESLAIRERILGRNCIFINSAQVIDN